jgi:anti-sigma B factor antagonist
MEFVVTELSGMTKAALDGRLDTANVEKIEQGFAASIVAQGRNTMIDLSKVTFVASLGIRLLLTTARALAKSGGRLVMFGATPAVSEILETTALSDIIPVFLSEEEAIGALGA